MSTEQKYTVELVGPGLSLKKELPEPVAHELLVWLLKGGRLQPVGPVSSHQPAPTDARINPTHPTESHSGGAVVSVREFMEQYSPGRLPDKLACFGLYLREHRNQKEFSREDLIGLFQEAAEPVPKNLTRDIRWTQQIAWVAPALSNPNLYYLTKKGEDAVRAKFAKELVQKTRFSAPTRRKNETPEDETESSSGAPTNAA